MDELDFASRQNARKAEEQMVCGYLESKAELTKSKNSNRRGEHKHIMLTFEGVAGQGRQKRSRAQVLNFSCAWVTCGLASDSVGLGGVQYWNVLSSRGHWGCWSKNHCQIFTVAKFGEDLQLLGDIEECFGWEF